MPAIIESIEKNSIAEELNLKKGDEVIKINGKIPKDLIDYKYLTTSEEIVLEIKKNNGSIEIIEIEKDFDENLGIIFENAVFDKIKKCCNNCIFCFVDQQPLGLRESLYVKDDDYRLSYLQGTYITLTNITKKDKERIQQLGLGPFYISLHTTNPELRAKMLRNPRAAEILEHLRWLKENFIPIHLQIVLCPSYNDGNELIRTLNDLIEFKDIILSLAVVPLGLTKYRKEALKPVTKDIAIETIEIIDNFNKKIKKQLACAADEFFLLAKKDIPNKKYYGKFSQLEDGVGTLRVLIDDFNKRKKTLPKKLKKSIKLHLVTAEAPKSILLKIQEELNKIENLSFNLANIKQDFWGEKITVTGLITGQDIINTLLSNKAEIDYLLIPSVMLRPFSNVFLDNITVDDIEEKLECKTFIIKDFYKTKDLVNFIQKFK